MARKDQSYVLWSIPKEILEFVLFPLADFESKDEIRNIAKENNLQTANKPDSEDICFIPDGDYKKFLEENSNIRPKVGNIVNKQGKVLGKHTGLYNYTIGQRKGLGLSMGKPVFVQKLDAVKNEVVIGDNADLFKTTVTADTLNFMPFESLEGELRCSAKIRYNQKPEPCVIRMQDDGTLICEFDEPQRAVTPGQALVLYNGEELIGGGTIIG